MSGTKLRAFIGASLLVTILAASTPTSVSGPLVLGWSLFATGLIVRAGWQARNQTEGLLPALGVASLLMTSGLAIRAVHGAIVGIEFPMPSPADLVHFPAYCALLYMLIRVHRARATRPDLDAWLDAATVGAGIVVVTWVSFYGDFLVDDEIPLATRLLNAPYDVILLVSAMLLLRITATPGRRPRAYYLLGMACTAFFAIDLAAGYSLARDSGLLITVSLSPLVYGLVVAAAYHPSASEILRPQHEEEFRVGVLRLILVGFAISAPLAISFLEPDPRGLTRPALILITVVLVLSVVFRMVRLLRLQERRAGLERETAQVVSNLAALTSSDEIREALIPAIGRLVPRVQGVSIATGSGGGTAIVPLPDSLRAHPGQILRFDGDTPALERRLIRNLVRDAGLVADSVHGIAISARHEADAAANQRIAENERRFRALVQNSSDLVFVLDDDGKVTYASESVTNVTGHPVDGFGGRVLSWLLHDNDVTIAQQVFRSVRSGSERETIEELRVRHADGTIRLFETVMSDMRDVPEVGGVVVNASDVTERRKLERNLRDAETTDPLTLLLNRNAFLDEVGGAIRRASVMAESVTIAIIDLDDFKTINDALGPVLADQVLIEVAQRIRRSIRISDTVARLSGDEFGVLMPDGYSSVEALAACERVLEDVARPFEIENRTISPHATAGLTTDANGESTATELLRNADVALTQAKTHMAGRALLYEDSMSHDVSERLELRTSFQQALTNGELRLAYQPIVDFDSGDIVSFEALARWRHPERGEISPAVFIPIAEDSNYISELGEWALRTACHQAIEWISAGFVDFTVSVNMSGHQLREVDVIPRVQAILDETGVDPERITIEITESVLIDDTDFIAERIRALRDMGVSLAIDDFGTGYSSLSYLQRYEFDILKIDRAFVSPLATDAGTREREIVAAIISLARGLGALTVAEGIEREEEFAMLSSLGCDRAQGFLFYRPTEVEDIPEIMAAATAHQAA